MSETSAAPERAIGTVSWFEIMGKDAGALVSFYQQVFGWTFKAIPEMGYHSTEPAQAPGGGIGAMPPHMPSGGYVTVYVKVADVEASLQQAVAAGASVLIPVMEIGKGMKIAVFNDPEGHPFGICDI